MATKLARYIKQVRIKQGLNYAELSRSMGYRNINKGMRRIVELEREGKADPEILRKVVKALNLNQGHVGKLTKEDQAEYKKEFERWLNEPIRMYYTIRMMPTIYLSFDLPANIKTEDEAVAYAINIAKEKGSIVWLNLYRKIKVFIDQSGFLVGRIINTTYTESSNFMRLR